MALSNYAVLKTTAKQIKNEVEDGRNTAERVGGALLNFVEAANTDILDAQRVGAYVEGGRVYSYLSVKDDAAQTLNNCRIYGDANASGGNILSGSTCKLYAFAVSAGDRFYITGMANDNSANPSICWAVYSSYITLSTDDTTAAALQAAFIESASDTDATPARSDVSAMFTIPSGAAMLVVSVPVDGDNSEIKKYGATQYSGLKNDVLRNASDIQSLQNAQSEQASRISTNESDIENLDAIVNGGESQQYESIKSSGTIYSHWRVYGDGQGGGGYIVTGDESCSLIAFAVDGGDVIAMTGLKNSANNPSVCWAVYSSYITPAADSATSEALSAAMIDCDSSATEGRDDVSASITLPSNARMLIVSIPATNDASTIKKLSSTSGDGLVHSVAQNAAKILTLQNNTNDLPTIRTNVSNLQTTATKQAQSITLLQDCIATNAKSLITTTRNAYGMVNNGRITSDGIIVRGSDGNTTYIFDLSAFNGLLFSASGLASNANNASLCWAVFNIPSANVDWSALESLPYILDWSNYLMAAYSDTSSETGRTGESIELLDLTNAGATFLVVSCLTASASDCEIKNYDSSQIETAAENAKKAADLVMLKNVLGKPADWNARTTATSGNTTATMTLNDTFAKIVVASSAATSGQRGMWLGFEAHNVVEGHKYIMMLRYRAISGEWGASYYNSAISWSGDAYVINRIIQESDYNVWKYDVGSQYFTAPSSGNLWIDFVVYVSDTTTGAATDAEFDIMPLLIDVTDTDLTCDSLAALLEKTGVFFDTMILSNYAANPLRSITEESFIALGDSTTGMMQWQNKLAKIKGWNWDARSNNGRTFNGVGYPYTAMGIGGTCVEPLIYGDGTSDTGCSQYIRARYAKYYEPSIIIVMCSYNGAHAGEHWGGNSAMPIQPADYGLAALIASGMNYDTGTYEDTYFGEEVDLVSNPSQNAPSFAASYFGMVWRLINDNPTARIILVSMMTDFMGAEYEVFSLKNAVIKHAAEVFHIPYVDANCAGLNKVNRTITRYDNGGVHFNEAGGLLLAKYIASQI